jgi:hypothetical protein
MVRPFEALIPIFRLGSQIHVSVPKSPASSAPSVARSLVPQSLQRIDPPGPPRRHPARQRRDDHEHQTDHDQSNGICWLHIEEERLQHARQQNRRDNPSDDAARNQLESLTEHQSLNIALLRSQCRANCQLALP